jgi:hypothetical protein
MAASEMRPIELSSVHRCMRLEPDRKRQILRLPMDF